MLVVPVRALALRVGMVDLPGPRKVHLTPIPLLGGLAMYAAVVMAVLFAFNGFARRFSACSCLDAPGIFWMRASRLFGTWGLRPRSASSITWTACARALRPWHLFFSRCS